MNATQIHTTAAARVVTFKINDIELSAPENQTILQAAKEYGIHIPTLCHLEGLRDIGACRLCMVEVKGSARLFPACVLHCREGLEVVTESERLRHHRKMLVEFLFSEGNHVCSICQMNGNCELQNAAQELGVDHISVPYLSPQRTIDASHPLFIFDHNRCILCTRCVRVCDQIEGMHNLDVMGRGIKTTVISDFNKVWGNSSLCTSCGKCVYVCPTGALYEKGKSGTETAHKRKSFLYFSKNVVGGK